MAQEDTNDHGPQLLGNIFNQGNLFEDTHVLSGHNPVAGQSPENLDETVSVVGEAKSGPAITFRPGTDILVPSGPKARFRANLAVLDTLAALDAAGRHATAGEQRVLAGWSSWGALPEVFDPENEAWGAEREQLRQRLTAQEWDAARVTTVNAHYTDPKIAQAMWSALREAGFDGGTVIEPGCGAGTFIGQAPDTAQMLGVELDPVTAKIAAYLYPEASIHGYGYEKFMLPEAAASAAIGNVPFGNFRVHDGRYNTSRLSIHNYFIAKSLRLVAPGGYAAFVTSSYTMDAPTSTAREEIAKYGDLVSAVRLPNSAFKAVAGTDVLTDVLVFRRRKPGETAQPRHIDQWVKTGKLTLGEHEVTANKWFIDNPSAIVGTVAAVQNRFGDMVMHVEAAGDHAELLRARLATDIALAGQDSLEYSPDALAVNDQIKESFTAAGVHSAPANEGVTVGQIRLSKDSQGLESYEVSGLWEPVNADVARMAEYRELVGIKETARELIDAQRLGTVDLEGRNALRASLLAQYQQYSSVHGPINRFEMQRGRKPSEKTILKGLRQAEKEWREDLDPTLSPAERRDMPLSESLVASWREELSQAVDQRIQPHVQALRTDPDYGLLLSVENFDEELREGRPSALCLEDIITVNHAQRSAQNPADALAISLDETRSINLERIGELLGVSAVEAREALDGLIFEDPVTNELVSSVHYLSGDVVSKLETAQTAVNSGHSEYQVNVDALMNVKPKTVEHFEINTKPGGFWIEPEEYEQFCLDMFKVSAQVMKDPLRKSWEVQGPPASKFDPAVQVAFGVGRRRSPLWLLEQVMNNRSLRVTKMATVTTKDGREVERSVEDEKATIQARSKGKALIQAFGTWLYQDDARRERVVARYNKMFNSYVAPDYTPLAGHLSLPWLSAKFTPHSYQQEAVARITNEPTVLLDHVVGAGKTGTMVMGCMELRRLGVAKKPWIVVPNHLVDQIAREFKQWAPSASVLPIPTGINEVERRRYVASSATGDWDAVIVPFSTFEKISVDPAKTARWQEQEIADIRAEMEKKKLKDGGKTTRITVKRLEAQIKRLEERNESLKAAKDAGLSFEDTGCDYLFIDEAHNFKNLRRSSDFPELDHSGSKRATDIAHKLQSLRETKMELAVAEGMDVSNYKPAVCTMATGTPVSNSLAEMYVMQKYLRPDLLEERGLETIDAWANQFTVSTTKVEMNAAGTEFHARERLSKFINVPELLAMTNQFASVISREDITAPLPTLVDGKRRPVVRAASEQVKEYVLELGERSENLPDDPKEDNLLKITGDGRMVALDPRFRGLDADPDGGRIGQVVEQVLRIHEATKDQVYENSFGEAEPLTGGLQILFSDRGTPQGGDEFNMYDAVATELVKNGIPRSQIAFIHDAKTGSEREDLFERCRNGKVRVLFGSTEKMGTGTNVQKRSVALHHIDIPWRPSDLEQREGRIIRQGNKNDQVEILNYITEGTFDVYMWQTVARKAEFIAQLKNADMDSRTVDDISGDFALMAAEMKALSTGNPKIIEYSQLVSDMHQLQVLETSHWNTLASLREQHHGVQRLLSTEAEKVSSITAAIARGHSLGGNDVSISVNGVQLPARDLAGRAIKQELTRLVIKGQKTDDFSKKPLASIGGFQVMAAWQGKNVHLTLDGVFGIARHWEADSWQQGNGLGLVTRLENMVLNMPSELEYAQQRLVKLQNEFSSLNQMDLRAPFPDAEQLEDLRTRAAALAEELGMSLTETDATEISEEQIPTVSGVELEELFVKHHDFSGYDLKVGDIINVRSGVNPKGMYEVVKETDVHGVQLVDIAGGDDAEIVTVEYPSRLTLALISRREDQLSLVEQALHTMPITDLRARRAREVNVGESVTVRGRSDREDVEVHGVVQSIGTGGAFGSLVIKDTAGVEHDVSFSSYHLIVRHDVVDPVAEAERLAQEAVAEAERRTQHTRERLMPGDLLTADEPGVGLRGDVLLTGLVKPTWRGAQKTFFSADGTVARTWAQDYNQSPRALAVVDGRELTADEVQALGFGEDSAEFDTTAKDLRLGDRLWSTDVDPKATVREEILITGNDSSGTRRELRYRPVAEPWAKPTRALRMGTTTVHVLGRRYGALTALEFATLSEPERVSETSLPLLHDEMTTGQWVHLNGFAAMPRNSLSDASDRIRVMGRLLSIREHKVSTHERRYYEATVEVEGREVTVGQFNNDNNQVLVYSGSEQPLSINYAGMQVPEPEAVVTAQEQFAELQDFAALLPNVDVVSVDLTAQNTSAAVPSAEPVFVDEPVSIIERELPIQEGAASSVRQDNDSVQTRGENARGTRDEASGRPSAVRLTGEHVSIDVEPPVPVFVEDPVSSVARKNTAHGTGDPGESVTKADETTAQDSVVESPSWDGPSIIADAPAPEGNAAPTTEPESAVQDNDAVMDPETVLPSEKPTVDASPATVREEAAAGGLVITHGPRGTKVTGTERGSTAIDGLKRAGFKWSSRQKIWFLTSTWKPTTRAQRVAQLQAQWEREGIGYVLTEAAESPTVQEPALPPAPAVADTVEADQVEQTTADPVPAEPMVDEAQEVVSAATTVSAASEPTVNIVTSQSVAPMNAPRMTHEAFVKLNLNRHVLLDVDQSQLSALLDADVVVHMDSIRGGSVLEGEIRLAGRSWPVNIGLRSSQFEFLSDAEERAFRLGPGAAMLTGELDALIGATASEVAVGSRVTVDAHEYRSLADLDTGRPLSMFENVELLSIAQSGIKTYWIVQDQETQRMVVLPRAGEHRVIVHDAGRGQPSVELEAFPAISTIPLADVQPGQRVTVRGISGDTEFSMIKELVTHTGEFLNIQEAASGEALVSLVVDGEPQYVVVNKVELDWLVDVETPVGFEPMVDIDVAEQYMAPELSDPSAGLDRQERRIMSADQVYPGSVLVNNAGDRVAVVDARRVNRSDVELVITPADNPTKQKSLVVSENKQFSVEPLPVALGAVQPVLADEIAVGYNYCQVWWDEASKDAGYHMTGATDIGNPTRTFRLEDGSGKSFRLTVDSRQELQVRLLQPDPVFTKDHSLDAEVEAQMEAQAMQDQMDHSTYGAGM